MINTRKQIEFLFLHHTVTIILSSFTDHKIVLTDKIEKNKAS